MYARVLREAAEAGLRVHPDVKFFIQFGSQEVKRYAESKGYLDIFRAVGAEIIEPSCGACINAGPGVSYRKETVTVSAINRNFPGRSGPGPALPGEPLHDGGERRRGLHHWMDTGVAGTDSAGACTLLKYSRS